MGCGEVTLASRIINTSGGIGILMNDLGTAVALAREELFKLERVYRGDINGISSVVEGLAGLFNYHSIFHDIFAVSITLEETRRNSKLSVTSRVDGLAALVSFIAIASTFSRKGFVEQLSILTVRNNGHWLAILIQRDTVGIIRRAKRWDRLVKSNGFDQQCLRTVLGQSVSNTDSNTVTIVSSRSTRVAAGSCTASETVIILENGTARSRGGINRLTTSSDIGTALTSRDIESEFSAEAGHNIERVRNL